MKNKKVYIFAIIATIILFVAFFSKYEKGEVGTWGVNRSITTEWNVSF